MGAAIVENDPDREWGERGTDIEPGVDETEHATGRALGCRRGTVKSKLSRAMARLRHELEQP